MSTRILLADDHAMVRNGLRALLQGEAGMEVVGEATNGRTAVRLAAELSPDVVVMDINLPDLNGIEATRQIRANNGDAPKVIALSAYSDERSTREMLRAGASAYVTKEAAFRELATALKLVVANQTYLSPSVATVVVDGYVRGANGDSDAFSALSS